MTEAQKGNIFIISGMILWSLFPIISLLGLKGIASIVALFWVNVFAMIFFFIIVIFRGRLWQLKNKKVWYYTFGSVISIHIFYYGLFFYALQKTTPANAAIVAMFEIVPSYIFFQVFHKEHFSKKHILGVILAVIGILIVLLPKAGKINPGDFIILIAVFFCPFGNWCTQQTRKIVSTESTIFLRHLVALPFLFVFATIFQTPVIGYDITPVIWWLLLNGIVIFGISKIFWIEGIHRMTVTRALAINSINPIFTVLFAWLLLHQAPTYTQLLALPFLIVAILILTNFKFKKEVLVDKV
ncbi:DMT family transporter [Candidatus Nomurabacteria bacterium]|nr:DMT family transporter [Candidatus Nomurabacteria bacterium]